MRRRDFIKAVSAVAWPLAARAQQPIKVPRIGVLWHAGNEQEEAIYLGAMRQGFRDIGYIQGKSLLLENRFPNERPDRMLSIRLIQSDAGIWPSAVAIRYFGTNHRAGSIKA